VYTYVLSEVLRSTCTLLAIIVPFTPSRTSNLLRSLRTLFGFSVDQSCY